MIGFEKPTYTLGAGKLPCKIFEENICGFLDQKSVKSLSMTSRDWRYLLFVPLLFNEFKKSSGLATKFLSMPMKRPTSYIFTDSTSIRGGGTFTPFRDSVFTRPSIMRTYYPELGRVLTSADIGSRIIRTRPDLRGDWSYIPDEASVSKLESALLIGIDAEGNLLKERNFLGSITVHKIGIENDGYWITVSEFETYMSSPFAKSTLWEKDKKLPQKIWSHTTPPTLPKPKMSTSKPIPKQWVDHSFYPPLLDESSKSEFDTPDFTSNDPHAILGLDKSEMDQTVIRNRYRKLARAYHPDKGVKEKFFFQKISAAYDMLKVDSSFVLDPEETSIGNADKVVLYWQEVFLDKSASGKVALSLKQIQAHLPLLLDFLTQINTITLPLEDKLIEAHFIRTKEKAECLLSYYQTKQNALSLILPDVSATDEEKEKFIEDTLKALEEATQSLITAPWNSFNLILFSDAQKTILDKYLSLKRSHLELFAGRNRTALVSEGLQFFLRMSSTERRVNKKAPKRDADFAKKVNALNPKPPVSTPSSPPTSGGAGQSSGSSPPSVTLGFCKVEKEVYGLEEELAALKANIAKNLNFFKELV